MIKSDLIRIYKSVHTWTGILSGMALFIAFYAGALTVFKEPLTQWASPPRVQQLVPLADAPALIAQTLAANPAAAKEFSVHLRETRHVPARMTWQVRDPHADDHDEAGTRHYQAWLDTQGAVQIDEAHPSSLGTLIDILHRVVGLPFDNDPSRWVMGVVSALYALALVSGVIVLLPSLVKDFFALRVGKNLKRMWLDAHNVVGIVSLPFHIIMALTAVIFAFHDEIYVAQDKLIHDGKWSTAFARPKQAPVNTAPRDPAGMRTPQQLISIVQARSPGFEPYLIQYQQVTGARAVARIWGKDDSAVLPRARGGFAAVDPYSGRIVNTDYLPGDQNTPNLFISSFFALHMAAFGGVAVQWMYFLLGLAGAWLFYSGNLLWIETRRRKAPKGSDGMPIQRRDTRLMASATIGVCLGCVCGLSLTIVGAKWLPGRVADVGGGHYLLYYGTFFAALGWSFLRGAARASVHLLWSAAILTLAIPLTTLLAALLPQLGPWANGDSTVSAVDMTALLMALGFALMARATARRVRHGVADSVWSARAATPAT